MKTYKINTVEGKQTITYSDGLTEAYYGVAKEGYVNEDAPNWLKLEQDLRYSAEFNKAFALASAKGLNLMTTTLVNGKLGDSSENGLAFAFQMLPIDYVNGEPTVLFEWTTQEKANINAALEANNFSYRLE